MFFGASGFILGPVLAALFVTVWDIFAIAFRRELAEPTSIITDPSAQQTAVGSFERVGKYYFQLTVTDDKGATGVASVVVTVIRRYINLDPLQPFIPFEPINSLDPIHRFNPTKPPVLPK